MILFHITFVYFFITENFFPENPFEFRMPDLILRYIFGHEDFQIPEINLFTDGKLDLAILFTIILIAYLVIQNLALVFSVPKNK